jgi:hypothetical protein
MPSEAFLRRMRERYSSEPDDPQQTVPLPGGQQLVEAREQVGAVLIRSARFGEVWLALVPSMRRDLVAEETRRTEPRPVLSVRDLVRLRGRSDETIRAVLAAIAVTPQVRWVSDQ